MTTHPLHFPVISLKKKEQKTTSPRRKEVGGRWANMCRQGAVRRTGVILEFHTAPRKLLPTTHRCGGSSPTRLNREMSTGSALAGRRWKKRLWLPPQNEALFSYPRNFSDILSFFFLRPRRPPAPHPSLTLYTLRNRHDGETCDTNWEPLGV